MKWRSQLRSDFSTQDTKHRLRSSLDSLLNVNVLLQMRRICWRSFSITLQHLSHHLCSVLYNKALFQEQKTLSRSCFTWYYLHPITGHIRVIFSQRCICILYETGMSVINHGPMRAVRALSCLSNVCSLNSLQLSNPDLWPTCKAWQSWRWPLSSR